MMRNGASTGLRQAQSDISVIRGSINFALDFFLFWSLLFVILSSSHPNTFER